MTELAGLGGAPAPAPAEVRGIPSWERLDRRVVVYWYLSDLASSLFLAGLLGAGLYFLHWKQRDWFHTGVIAASVLGGLLLLTTLLAPPLAFACWGFAIDGELLHMRYGILFREERAVPIARMQHVDLMRGPIERLFGLATLVVFTAGNEGSAFRVPGLSIRRAQELRDRILAARGSDVL